MWHCQAATCTFGQIPWSLARSGLSDVRRQRRLLLVCGQKKKWVACSVCGHEPSRGVATAKLLCAPCLKEEVGSYWCRCPGNAMAYEQEWQLREENPKYQRRQAERAAANLPRLQQPVPPPVPPTMEGAAGIGNGKPFDLNVLTCFNRPWRCKSPVLATRNRLL